MVALRCARDELHAALRTATRSRSGHVRVHGTRVQGACPRAFTRRRLRGARRACGPFGRGRSVVMLAGLCRLTRRRRAASGGGDAFGFGGVGIRGVQHHRTLRRLRKTTRNESQCRANGREETVTPRHSHHPGDPMRGRRYTSREFPRCSDADGPSVICRRPAEFHGRAEVRKEDF